MTKPHTLLFDFETTGLKPGYHEPIQVAAVLLDPDLVEVAAFESLIRPLRPEVASPEAMDTHKKPMETLLAAPHPAEVFTRLVEMAAHAGGPVVLSGYNVPFDAGFLEACEEAYGFRLPRVDKALDVLPIARAFYKAGARASGFKLGQVAERLGVSADGAHDALADVRMTAEVLRRIRQQSPHVVPDWTAWLAAAVERVNPRPALAVQEVQSQVMMFLEKMTANRTATRWAEEAFGRTPEGKALANLTAEGKRLEEELKAFCQANGVDTILTTSVGKVGFRASIRLEAYTPAAVREHAPELAEKVIVEAVDKAALEKALKGDDNRLATIKARSNTKEVRTWVCEPGPVETALEAAVK